MPSLLILEDDRKISEATELMAREFGFDKVFKAKTLDEAKSLVEEHRHFHAISIDLNLADENKGNNIRRDGLTFCELLRKSLGCCVVIYSGNTGRLSQSERQDLESAGVQILTKPQHADKLEQLLANVARLHSDAEEPPEFDEMLQKAAISKSNVLLFGPSGCGKERAARRIASFGLSLHGIDRSSNTQTIRRDPIQTICCGAISDELLLSELFGHVPGAFTNATEPRVGRLLRAGGWYPRMSVDEAKGESKKNSRRTEDWFPIWIGANGPPDPQTGCYLNDEPSGYLILDELSDMPRRAQEALLRALDNYGVAPLGYDGPPFRPNFHVIGIVNTRGLSALGDPQRFLPDLRYRIEQYSVQVYRLSQRADYVMRVVEMEVDAYIKRLTGSDFTKPLLLSLSLDADSIRYIESQLPKFDEDGGFRRLLAWVRRACVEAAYAYRSCVLVSDLEETEGSEMKPRQLAGVVASGLDPEIFRGEVNRVRAEIEELLGGLDVGWLKQSLHARLDEMLKAGDAPTVMKFKKRLNNVNKSTTAQSKMIFHCALLGSMIPLPSEMLTSEPATWRTWFVNHKVKEA